MTTELERKLDARQYARNMAAAKGCAKDAPMMSKLLEGKARVARAQYRAELERAVKLARRRVAALGVRR